MQHKILTTLFSLIFLIGTQVTWAQKPAASVTKPAAAAPAVPAASAAQEGVQKLVDRVFEGSSKNPNASAAKQEIINQATESASVDIIKEMIGETKYQKNKGLIANKILKSTGRFVPFLKPSDIQKVGDDYKMSVNLKISLPDLQALLLENGLLYESDGAPIVLPTLLIQDQVQMRSYKWWMDTDLSSKAFLVNQNRVVDAALKQAFAKSNFYVMQPVKSQLNALLPSVVKNDNLRLEDLQFMGEYLNAQIAIQGDVRFEKSKETPDAFQINLRLSGVQMANGRIIAEVARQFETERGNFEVVTNKKMKEIVDSVAQDLAAQILDAWQKGTFGASLIKLTFRGHIPPMAQEQLKEVLKTKAREVKNVRERMITADQITLEADATMSAEEVASRLKNVEFSGLKAEVTDVRNMEVIYKITK